MAAETQGTTGQVMLALELPDRPEVVEEVASYCHTGRAALRQPEMVEALVRDALFGHSQRMLARRYSLSHNTIRKVLDVLEREGKLDALRTRFAGQMMVLAQDAAEALHERILRDQVPAQVLPIAMGVAVDKALLLMGQATQIVAVKKGPEREEFEGWGRDLPGLAKPARVVELGGGPDSGSGGLGTDRQQIGDGAIGVASLEAGPGAKGTGGTEGAEGTDGAGAEGGGGGV